MTLRPILATLLATAWLVSAAAAQTVDFTASPLTSTSFPQTVDFTDLSVGSNPVLWLWKFGDGHESLEQNPSHTYDQWGDYTVSLTVLFGVLPVTEVKPDYISIGGGIEPDFQATPAIGTDSLQVHFTETSTGAPSESVLWDFGDGQQSSEPSPTHAYPVTGDYTVSLTAWVNGLSATVVKPAAVSVVSSAVLRAVYEGAEDEAFGRGVDLQGDTLAVGRPGDGVVATQAGAVSVYDIATGALVAELRATDASASDILGTTVVVDQGLVLAAAPHTSFFWQGAAYLFDATTGQQLHKLESTDLDVFDAFADAVDLRGNLALVGAPGEDDDSGAAYLFDVTTGQQIAKLQGAGSDDRLGEAVALGDGVAFVGAPHAEAPGALFAGAVWVYDLTTGHPIDKLQVPGAGMAEFGTRLALDGDRLLIGAPRVDDNTGAVYVYDAITRELLHELQTPDLSPGDQLGWRLAIAGNLAVVGVPFQNAPGLGIDTGAVYFFDVDTGAYRTKLTDPMSMNLTGMGYSVAADGDTVVVGELLGTGGDDITVVRLFDSGAGPWDDLGQALAGSFGAPWLKGAGAMIPGEAVSLSVEGAASSAPAFGVIGFSNASLPFKGGVLVPSPDVLLGGFVTGALGGFQLMTPFPPGVGSGATFFFQFWIGDAGGPFGFAASNGLSGTTP